MRPYSRASVLRRGGAVLLATGAASSLLAGEAAAAVPDGDLTYLRLLIGCELLEADVQTQAAATGLLAAPLAATVKVMHADENAHYNGLAQLVAASGQVPATSDDIDFSYPTGSFASQDSIVKLARSIEVLTLGAYLGAVQNVQTPQFRLPLGQIAANEAQHVGALALAQGKPVIGRAFAPSLTIDDVSAALDGYES